MQEVLGRPEVRLVNEDVGDLYFVLPGAELRATDDGWIITQELPDGSVAAVALDGNARMSGPASSVPGTRMRTDARV